MSRSCSAELCPLIEMKAGPDVLIGSSVGAKVFAVGSGYGSYGPTPAPASATLGPIERFPENQKRPRGTQTIPPPAASAASSAF
jgi:hypothetical protein